MRQFAFSEDNLAEIQHDRYHHPHPFVQRKMEVLWLKAHGLPHHEIAKLAACSVRSVHSPHRRRAVSMARMGRLWTVTR